MRNEDKKQMQEDLEVIYKWAEENKMKFNANKFEQIVHGKRENVDVYIYGAVAPELTKSRFSL